MTRHHDCIGITSERQLIDAVNAGTRTRRAGGWSSLFQDSNGARMSAWVSDKGIECTHPSFDGTQSVAATVLSIENDRTCSHCFFLRANVFDSAGLLLHPQVFLMEDTSEHPQFEAGETLAVRPVAFVERIQMFRDPDDYWAGQPPDTKVGPGWLIHSGAMKRPSSSDAERPQADSRVLLIGEVREARQLINTFTGVPFTHALVQSYQADLDVVIADADLATPLEPGNVLRASCWVVARASLSA